MVKCWILNIVFVCLSKYKKNVVELKTCTSEIYDTKSTAKKPKEETKWNIKNTLSIQNETGEKEQMKKRLVRFEQIAR